MVALLLFSDMGNHENCIGTRFTIDKYTVIQSLSESLALMILL